MRHLASPLSGVLAGTVLALLGGCHRQPGVARVPSGQEVALAKIAREAPGTAPPRTGGFIEPQRVGREIRAQAVRPPTPGPIQPPPPGT